MLTNRLLKTALILLASTGLVFGASAAQLKLATVAPEGSAWMNAMRAGADEIKQRTDGRVSVKFYGGGVMGNEASVTRKIRIGQLHGGAFTTGGISRIYPDFGIYSLPFLFESAEEAAYVRQHMDSVLIQGLEESGFIGFGLAQGGFGKLMSADKMRTLDDLKGKKLWVPEDDDMSFEVMRELGLSPVKLPLTDVLTGLQTQLLEIVGTSAIGAIALQWHTKIKYVLDQPLVYIYGTLVIDKRFFSKLDAADQVIVKEVFGRVYKKIDADNYADN
ncbi:MAG: TRAP transporter substrate-binding protein DctP, partial [Gammaproteobacteria bacterium]|nr:TRAP transporter substrate-binding protein DctP [Gammaproteobacteria bacterium]